MKLYLGTKLVNIYMDNKNIDINPKINSKLGYGLVEELCKNSVLDSLNEDSKKLINKTYGNAERFILDRLEVIYAGLKAENKVK